MKKWIELLGKYVALFADNVGKKKFEEKSVDFILIPVSSTWCTFIYQDTGVIPLVLTAEGKTIRL